MSPLAILAVFMVPLTASPADRGEWTATLTSALRSLDRGQCREAEPLVRHALQQAGEFGPAELAYTLRAAGTLEYCLGKFQEAKQSYRKALRILEPLDGHRLAVSRLYHDLGSSYMAIGGHLTEAEDAFRSSLEILASIPGPAIDEETAQTLDSLAGVVIRRGARGVARDLFERAFILAEKPPGALRAAATALNGLGVVAFDDGRNEQALAYFKRSTEVWRQIERGRHPDVIPSLLNSGILYLKMRRPLESLPVLREAQEIAEAGLGADDPLLAEVLLARSEALSKTGRRKGGQELKRRSELIRSQRSPGGTTISVRGLMDESSRK